MLVLSRKESQRIRLGDSIFVTVVKIAGDKVRLGIEAPSDILVLRDELETWDDAQRIEETRNDEASIALANAAAAVSCTTAAELESAPVALTRSA